MVATPPAEVHSEIDDRLVTYARAISAYYREVFGTPPEIGYERFPGGDYAIRVEEWLWVYWSHYTRRWVCRTVIPADDPLFDRCPCLAEDYHVEAEREEFSDIVLYVVSKDSHRRFHLAHEELKRRAGMEDTDDEG